MRPILLNSVCNALWTDNMRQHDEASRATIFNLAVGMWEAARTNRIFTNGFATQGEMYIMAVAGAALHSVRSQHAGVAQPTGTSLIHCDRAPVSNASAAELDPHPGRYAGVRNEAPQGDAQRGRSA
jgi:hypothetical protein